MERQYQDAQCIGGFDSGGSVYLYKPNNRNSFSDCPACDKPCSASQVCQYIKTPAVWNGVDDGTEYSSEVKGKCVNGDGRSPTYISPKLLYPRGVDYKKFHMDNPNYKYGSALNVYAPSPIPWANNDQNFDLYGKLMAKLPAASMLRYFDADQKARDLFTDYITKNPNVLSDNRMIRNKAMRDIQEKADDEREQAFLDENDARVMMGMPETTYKEFQEGIKNLPIDFLLEMLGDILYTKPLN